MHKIFLALGSNVGDKTKNIETAIALLGEKVTDIRVASLYTTKPVGYVDQDNFVNTAVAGNTSLTPEALLTFVKDIEQKVGRIFRFRWGPREIDIDILFYDDVVLKQDALEIPHPRLQERDFVLVPMLDIEPDFVHPILHKTVQELRDALPQVEHSILQKLQR